METHITTPKAYLGAFLALMVLLVLSVLAARIEHGTWNLIVALMIATLKMIVIATVFMGIHHGTTAARLAAVAGLAWLTLLLALLMADYLTRAPIQDKEPETELIVQRF